MSERNLVRSDDVLLEPRRPRFIVSRRQSTIFVLLAYVAVVAAASLLLKLVELTQGYDDHRNIDATIIFAIILALPCGWALIGANRRTRLPALSPAE
jgi:cytochrome b